jgi:hypothetical protein
MKDIYVSCDCGTEVLKIEYNEEDKEYYIGIYQFKKKYSIRDKLRGIWRIIRNGEPFGDQVVISKEKMDKVIEELK